MRSDALAMLVALTLAGPPALAELGARPAAPSDSGPTYRLTCDVCADGWAVTENLSLAINMLVFAEENSGGSDAFLLPVMTLASATLVGFDAGVLLLSGQWRPVSDWLVVFVARTAAMLLSWVAATQLPQAAAIPVAIVLAAAGSLPQFLMSPGHW